MDLSDTEKYLKIIDDRNKEIERQKNAGKPAEERTIDNEENLSMQTDRLKSR